MDSNIYLDTYLLQKDMRIRMPKAILTNLAAKKGETEFDVFYSPKEEAIILKVHNKKATDSTAITVEQPFTGVSLFTGAGGMDVGFEKAGVRVIFANELVKEAADTYNANHPAGVMVNEDIYKVLDTDMLDQFRGADLVFGGPPCQGFSVAGKMDPDDDRSKLIFTFLDVVERVQPRAFVMENVKALGYLEKWSDVRAKYMTQAQNLGYYTVPFILNATEYGVSQKRERVFFIGIKDWYNQVIMEELLEKEKNPAPTIRELLTPLGRAGTIANPNTCTARITFATSPVMRKSPYSGIYFNGQGRPINVDDYANTLPASMGGNKTPFVDEDYLYGDATEDWVVAYHKGLVDGSIIPEFKEAPSRLRRITVKEAAKIQTFPDDYVFCGGKGAHYTQIGNAVPCKMAEAVARAVVTYLRDYDKREKE